MQKYLANSDLNNLNFAMTHLANLFNGYHKLNDQNSHKNLKCLRQKTFQTIQ